MEEINLKCCKKCNEYKSVNDFYNRSYKRGICSVCKKCTYIFYNKKDFYKNQPECWKEKKRMKDKITYQTNHNNRRDKNKITGLSWALRYPEKIMLNSARARAKKLNIEFNLAVEDIIIPEFCPLLGIKLQTKTGDRSNSMFCPSLDRINPEKGYIKGNVAVISQKANLMKNGASKKELLTFSKNIKTYLKKLCIDAQNATPKMLKH